METELGPLRRRPQPLGNLRKRILWRVAYHGVDGAAAVALEARQEMDMQVLYRLTACLALIDSDGKAVRFQASGQALRYFPDRSKKRPNFRFRQVQNVPGVNLGYDHRVSRRLGHNIQKSQGVGVFKNHFCRYFFIRNFTKETIVHWRKRFLISSTSLAKDTVSCKLLRRSRTMMLSSNTSF